MQFIVNKDDIIKTIESNQLLIDEELHIYEVLRNKYPLFSISKYAKIIGKTPNGVRYMIKKQLLPVCEINGEIMIINLT